METLLQAQHTGRWCSVECSENRDAVILNKKQDDAKCKVNVD